MTHHQVLIVGSGFAGIGMAIRLRDAGLDDVVLLERASSLGGTWQANRYPGCACDVESVLYSFSFAPNPDWSRTFATQPEIEAHLVRLAEAHGITPLIHFGEEVRAARWDAARARWEVVTGRTTWTADTLILARGPSATPSVPTSPASTISRARRSTRRRGTRRSRSMGGASESSARAPPPSR